MPTYLQTGGQTSLLNTSSTGPGTWVPVHPRICNYTLQVVHTGSSVGSTVTSVVQFEASNDGVNPLTTLLGTVTISSAGSPGVDGFAVAAHWNFVRANISSISTGSINVIASAQVPA